MTDDWIVYSRSGCGLCEEFMHALAELLGDFATRVQVIDIDGDLDLMRRYADRIPVLTVAGDFVCAYRLDAERVRRYLAE
jgi:ABC-type uncharacterized transport system ATPase subunit